MTKDQELLILDEAIDKLGKDSYCGNWLRGVFDDVARSLRCDIFPETSIAEAVKSCKAIQETANDYYEARTKSARETAERIIADARDKAKAVYAGSLNAKKADLGQLIRDLQRLQEAL